MNNFKPWQPHRIIAVNYEYQMGGEFIMGCSGIDAFLELMMKDVK